MRKVNDVKKKLRCNTSKQQAPKIASKSAAPDADPVKHARTQKLHIVMKDSITTLCGYWNCGSRSAPTAHAEFFIGEAGSEHCKNCKVRATFRGAHIDHHIVV